MGVAAAIAGGTAVAGLGGALLSSGASKSAASQQAAAAQQASANTLQQYNQTAQSLAPFRNTGSDAALKLEQIFGLSGPPGTIGNSLNEYGFNSTSYNPADYGLGNGVFQPTEAQLEATPGYQFDLSQGLKATQNSAAAMGQGVSGAALKAAAQYATGLADNTLNTQANIYGGNVARTQGVFQQNLSNIINPLMQIEGTGENAGAQSGTIGANAVNASSNLLTGAANAGAAGTVGSANALSSGLSSAANAPLNYLLYSNLLGGGANATPGGNAPGVF